MTTRYSFTVMGSGPFPHALLEAEGCWPASMGDSEAMLATCYRRVELEGPAPDIAKWNAAGWIVRVAVLTEAEGAAAESAV